MMAGVKSKKYRTSRGKWRGWFTDCTGRQKWFTGTTSRAETLRIARRQEDEHLQIRLGYRPIPDPSVKHRNRTYAETVEEYLADGMAHGGRRGYGWGETHARMRHSHLRLWGEKLDLQTLGDMTDILPQAEAVLRELDTAGRSGKTISHIREALNAFCRWCVDHGYLAGNPVDRLDSYRTDPMTRRRSLTKDEITRLLTVTPPHRRLLYKVAICSGLRAGELRALIVEDLDVENERLHLRPEWTKNRRPGFQPLPGWLVEELREATALKAGGDRLLAVPSHPAREFDTDCRAADIPKVTSAGHLVFHAMRNCYATLVDGAGATPKEAMALVRHATPKMTFQVYAQTTECRLRELVERVGETLKTSTIQAHSKHLPEACAELRT